MNPLGSTQAQHHRTRGDESKRDPAMRMGPFMQENPGQQHAEQHGRLAQCRDLRHGRHGHGPQGIIDKLKSVAKTEDFNHRIAVLDADIPLTAESARWLQKEKIHTIVSVPAIEAPLLAILGKPTPDTTEACKRDLQKHAPGNPTEANYHEKHFPHDKLEQARGKVSVLDELIAAVSTE